MGGGATPECWKDLVSPGSKNGVAELAAYPSSKGNIGCGGIDRLESTLNVVLIYDDVE